MLSAIRVSEVGKPYFIKWLRPFFLCSKNFVLNLEITLLRGSTGILASACGKALTRSIRS